MATTLTTNIIGDIVCSYINAADMGTVRYPAYLKTTQAFANGTGNLQANAMWADTRTLGSGASDTLVLYDGSLLNAFGDTLEFDILKALYIKSSDQNTVDITLSDDFGLFSLAGDAFVLKPGGFMLCTAPSATGYALAPTSPYAGTLTVTAGAASVTYDIFVIGVEA